MSPALQKLAMAMSDSVRKSMGSKTMNYELSTHGV